MTQQITTIAPTSQPAHRARRTLSPRWRKTVLTVHVGMSVGWLGATYTMIMLGLVAWRSTDPNLRHGAYLFVHDANLMVMIPCSVLGLATGLVLALSSPWRLTHHRWVLTKFTLTLVAILFAALYVSQRATSAMARTSGGTAVDLGSLGWQVVLGSVVLALILVVNTTLASVKPWGRTRWGRAAAQR